MNIETESGIKSFRARFFKSMKYFVLSSKLNKNMWLIKSQQQVSKAGLEALFWLSPSRSIITLDLIIGSIFMTTPR